MATPAHDALYRSRGSSRYTSPMTAGSTPSRVIPANEYRRQRWRNALGWTREIHVEPASPLSGGDPQASPDWAWRLSIAEIDQDARFSTFAGIDRELLLLNGNGMRLHFDDGETALLEPPHGRLRFIGERGVAAELVAGPTQDFNLMWRRDLFVAEMLLRPLVGPMLFFAEPRMTWALHMLSGNGRFDVSTGLPALQAGDTAILSESSRTRFLLDGGGELLAIRLASIV